MLVIKIVFVLLLIKYAVRIIQFTINKKQIEIHTYLQLGALKLNKLIIEINPLAVIDYGNSYKNVDNMILFSSNMEYLMDFQKLSVMLRNNLQEKWDIKITF